MEDLERLGRIGRVAALSMALLALPGVVLAQEGVIEAENESSDEVMKTAAVFGHSNSATGKTYGLYGLTDSTTNLVAGTYGEASADSGMTRGVVGICRSASSGAYGVYGSAAATFGQIFGVYGNSPSSIDGRGVVGHAGANSGSRYGVGGSVGGIGYGFYTDDNLYVGGTCTGCSAAFIAQNASSETLLPGTVVSVSGVGPILRGHSIPVLSVRGATTTDPSVLGVVHMRGEVYTSISDEYWLSQGELPIDEEGLESSRAVDGVVPLNDSVQPVEGAVQPGDYLFVVTSGLAQVRVEVTNFRLMPGERIAVAFIPGMATRASGEKETASGLVIGRAMESEPDKDGLIWAMIGAR